MVAYAPYVAGTAALSSVIPAPTYPAGYNVTSTVSTLDYCKAATVTVYEYVDEPTGYPTTNAHGHGGPYYNPYNDIPLPWDWPGKPEGDAPPPPIPTPPYEYGGPANNQYEAPCWIHKGQDKLKSSLPKGKQNGDSKWGEIDCPHLPVDGLPEYSYPPIYTTSKVNPPYPTGSYSANYTSTGTGTSYSTGTGTGTSTPTPACPTMPDTGITRTYNMNVAYQTIAPDGVTRNGLTVNGQFPGPLVEANWGDWILFKVTNDLDDEGTSIHAHGLFQTETSWYDGVPAVAQCPITPNGGTLDMLFRADRYGTSWWHSHYSAQYSGGAHGPMIIYGPKHTEYDIDIGPVVLEDWFHADYFSLVNRTMNRQFPPSNNVLINGKMNYPCQNTTLPCEPNAGVSKFKFESGKKHLIRLINAGAEGVQKFSIDGHSLTVTAVDFIPVEPYTTNVVTLSVGQRTDIVVEAIGEPGDSYWMRSALGTNRCTLNDGISNVGVAAVYYEDADTDSVPETATDVTAEQLASCKNDPLDVAIPLCPIEIEDVPAHRIDFSFKSNGSHFVWYVDDGEKSNSYRGDYNQPILLKARNGETDFEPEWNVMQYPGETSVRLHLVNSGLIGGHPMHLHGHDFHVLAEGFGEWDGTVTNPSNSVRRDVHTLQNAHNTTGTVEPSFIVIQFKQDNPGVWPLHCHLAWHVSGGLFMSVLERPDDIMTQEFDEDIFTGCDLWDAYTALNPPNQIDSGL